MAGVLVVVPDRALVVFLHAVRYRGGRFCERSSVRVNADFKNCLTCSSARQFFSCVGKTGFDAFEFSRLQRYFAGDRTGMWRATNAETRLRRPQKHAGEL